MTELQRRAAGDTGVIQHRHADGSRTWRGGELELRRALDLARRNGRLATEGELEPIVNVPGEFVVRVRLVEAPAPAPAVPRVRTAARPRWVRVVWIAIAATCAASLAGIAIAMLLGALAAILPVLLGAAVVLGIGWALLHLFGGGGGGSGGGGVTLTQTQTITIR